MTSLVFTSSDNLFCAATLNADPLSVADDFLVENEKRDSYVYHDVIWVTSLRRFVKNK